MPSDPFYVSVAWVRLRNVVRGEWRGAGKPCNYCGKPFLPEDRVIVDHVIPRQKRPDLALVKSNLVCVHHSCNSRKASWHDNRSKLSVNEEGFPADWA